MGGLGVGLGGELVVDADAELVGAPFGLGTAGEVDEAAGLGSSPVTAPPHPVRESESASATSENEGRPRKRDEAVIGSPLGKGRTIEHITDPREIRPPAVSG